MTEASTFYRLRYYTLWDVLRERASWQSATERGETSQRFGQWFWNRYSEQGRWPELFYCRSTNRAAQMLIEAISGYQR